MIQYILLAAQIVMLYMMLTQLKYIAQDTRKKEEIADALDKLSVLMGGESKKVVKFSVKKKEDEL